MSNKPAYVLEGRPFYFDLSFEDPVVEGQIRMIGPQLPIYATIIEPRDGDIVRLVVESNWTPTHLAHWRQNPELKATIHLSSVYLSHFSTRITGLSLAAFGEYVDGRLESDRANEAWWFSMKQE